MDQFFETIGGPGGKHLAPVIAIITSAIVVALIVAITQWRKHRQAELDAGLIQEMLQRGMSADDIAKVLSARNEKEAGSATEVLGKTSERPGTVCQHR